MGPQTIIRRFVLNTYGAEERACMELKCDECSAPIDESIVFFNAIRTCSQCGKVFYPRQD